MSKPSRMESVVGEQTDFITSGADGRERYLGGKTRILGTGKLGTTEVVPFPKPNSLHGREKCKFCVRKLRTEN